MKLLATALVSMLLCGITSASQAETTKPGALRVGAAKVDITLAESELPKPYLGILDRVYSRAIVMDNGTTSAALITVDINSISTPMWTRLSERMATELGIPAKNIVLTGTSTHSSPLRAAAGGPGSVPNPSTPDPTEEKIFQSVKLAKEKLQPARMSYGTGVSYINVQRDTIDPKTHGWWEGPNYEGTSDKTVAVIKFESMSGEPIAVYFNYAVFNVIAGTLDLVSGDVTDSASQYIEESFDNKAVAVFSAGPQGDQNPIFFQQTYDLRDIRIKDYAKRGEDISNKMPPGGTGLDRNDPAVARLMKQEKQMIVSMGQMLGEEVLHVMRGTTRAQSTVQIYGNRTTVSCPGRKRTNAGRGGIAGTYEDAPPVEIPLSVLMIGDVAVGWVNASVYNEIGQRLKKESPYAKTILATAAYSSIGYIPDDASYGHETFEVLGSKLKPGCAESAIVNGIIDMMPQIMY